MTTDASRVLRHARAQTGLTQREFAERTGVSETAISQYERGVGRPTRRTVLRLAHGGGFDRATTNALLRAAGYAPLAPLSERELVPLAEIFHEAGTYRWPCLVLNETADIVAWNEPANRVAELDFARDLSQRYQRSLFHVAALDHIYRRVRNWPAVMRVMAQMYKNNDWELAQVEREPAYYQRLITHIAQEHTARFNELWGLWATTPPPDEEGRWTVRADWRLGDGTDLTFNCIIGPWDTLSTANAFDWFPADAQTWRWLDGTAPAPSLDGAPFEVATKPDEEQVTEAEAVSIGVVVGRLLRTAREYLGLTRPEVFRRTGIAVDTLLSLERARRQPTEATLMRLVDLYELDGVMVNALRSALGLDPVPSDLACFIAGLPQRRPYWHYLRGENARRARERLPHTIAAHPWPCLIVDESCTVIVDNLAIRRVVGRALVTPAAGDRQLLAIVFGEQFREQVVNWYDLASALIPSDLRAGMLSGGTGGAPPRLGTVLARLIERDPEVRRAIGDLAVSTEPARPRARVVFPLVWQHADGSSLAFICVISSWSPHHALWAMDWHPADAETWDWLAART